MKIGVIMGGVSSEYEVSLSTGSEIIENLYGIKHEVRPVIFGRKEELAEKVRGLDFVILALHGRFGEDGTVQGFLDTLGIPYTGSGVLSSALCMNKDIAKKLMRYEGILTPDWRLIKSAGELDGPEAEKTSYPVVVKPNSGGSSIGTYIAGSGGELRAAALKALELDSEVIIEEYIEGDEITCSVLNGRLLPILSIRPGAEFFDYDSKYTEGAAEETAARLPENLRIKVKRMALKCCEIFKCGVYARIDMMLKDGVPYVLEVNTLPGLTKTSLFPKAAAEAGISYDRLLELLIEYSMAMRNEER